MDAFTPSTEWLTGQRWHGDTLVGVDALVRWDEDDAAGPRAVDRFLGELILSDDGSGIYYRGGYTVTVVERTPTQARLRVHSAGEDGLGSAEAGADVLYEVLSEEAPHLDLAWEELPPQRLP